MELRNILTASVLALSLSPIASMAQQMAMGPGYNNYQPNQPMMPAMPPMPPMPNAPFDNGQMMANPGMNMPAGPNMAGSDWGNKPRKAKMCDKHKKGYKKGHKKGACQKCGHKKEMHAKKLAHMANMEERLANIEKLMQELVELQKAK